MSKVIFQIGLLAFLVCIVFFGTQGFDLLETVSRSFLILIAVVAAAGILLTLVSLFTTGSGRGDAGLPGEQQPSPHDSTGFQRSSHTAARSAK